MSAFFTVSSYGDNAEAVLQDCMQQLVKCPSDANVGFIYVSDSLAESLQDILHHCKITSGVQHWLGSLGVGIIADNMELYDQHAISIMLCYFPHSQFSIIAPAQDEAMLINRLQPPVYSNSCFALVHVDGYNPHSRQLISAIDEIIENCFVCGGFTSSHYSQAAIADEVVTNSLSGIVFSDEINIQTNLTQGCSTLGKKHTVTRAQKNIAIELDNLPALDVLYQEIGEVLSRDIQKAANYVFTGLCNPGSDRSDYMVRSLVGVDEQQKVFAINDTLTEENEIIFCRRDGNAATEDMLGMLKNLKKRLHGKHPRGGIYISCLGRGREQFGDQSEEVGMIHQILGSFPLTGFFANGEIHHNRVYGYTGVLTLFL